MMVTVRSLGLTGITGYEVSVECFLSGGLPGFDVVGLPDTAVREARERVRAAVKTCGARFPVSRITVNLAPANQRKEGTVYDLPILLGLLTASEELPPLPEEPGGRERVYDIPDEEPPAARPAARPVRKPVAAKSTAVVGDTGKWDAMKEHCKGRLAVNHRVFLNLSLIHI